MAIERHRLSGASIKVAAREVAKRISDGTRRWRKPVTAKTLINEHALFCRLYLKVAPEDGRRLYIAACNDRPTCWASSQCWRPPQSTGRPAPSKIIPPENSGDIFSGIRFEHHHSLAIERVFDDGRNLSPLFYGRAAMRPLALFADDALAAPGARQAPQADQNRWQSARKKSHTGRSGQAARGAAASDHLMKRPRPLGATGAKQQKWR